VEVQQRLFSNGLCRKGVVSELIKNRATIIIVAALFVTVMQIPSSISEPGLAISSPGYNTASEGYGHISGVPYQWQEINGFCQWAALSMSLQHAGAPLDLHTLFAASGIGFSYSYLRYEDMTLMLAGAWFKQMEPLPILAELYGLDIEIYIDPSGTFGALYSDALSNWGIGYTSVSGYNGALGLLRDTIDSGYPLVLWTDPYHLPLRDYQIARDLGIESAETGSGHAITVVGYNDTSGTVMVQDPGAGAAEPEFGYPSDGRWLYEVNYTQLDNAWRALGYGTVVVKPGSGQNGSFQSTLVNYILDRLRGDRTSYAEGFENIFFWNFGADAFMGASLDLTPEGIISYLDEIDAADDVKQRIFRATYLMFEASLGIQYLAFRKAVDALPPILPELDLSEFMEYASESLPHFEAIGDNASLVQLDYEGGNTILSETANNIAQAWAETDLETALAQYDTELASIREHLTAIAESWSAAADALEAAFNKADYTIPIVIGASVVIVIAIVVLVRRRGS
jgi:hypothetical protein